MRALLSGGHASALTAVVPSRIRRNKKELCAPEHREADHAHSENWERCVVAVDGPAGAETP